MGMTSDNNRGFSRAGDLSYFYGTVLVLLGLVTPMTEALKHSWLTNHYVAAFVTYLYTTGSAFIIYLLVHESILKKRHAKELEEEEGNISESETGSIELSPNLSQMRRRAVGYDNLGLNFQEQDSREPESPGNELDAVSLSSEKETTPQVHDKNNTPSTSSSTSEDGNASQVTNGSSTKNDLDAVDSAGGGSGSGGGETGSINKNGNNGAVILSSVDKFKHIHAIQANDDAGSTASIRNSSNSSHRVNFNHHHPPVQLRKRHSANSILHARRFSSVHPSSHLSDQHAPDDVYNYIATHMGTATVVNDGTSDFLKAGSLVFAIANIVYVALRIEGDHKRMNVCNTEVIVYPHYMHLVFIVLQTFFLLKECTIGPIDCIGRQSMQIGTVEDRDCPEGLESSCSERRRASLVSAWPTSWPPTYASGFGF